MKKAYSIVVTLCLALIVCSSCMKDQAVQTAPDCAIVSFGVGGITTAVTVKNEEGKEEIVKRTIYAGEIHLSINQLPNENGQYIIENKDSVPYWLSLEKVQPRFQAYGNVYMKTGDGGLQGITSEGDSLNFTNGLTLKVTSTDGAYSKEYLVRINKYSSATDTVTWTGVTDADLQLDTDNFRTLSLTADDERAYIFSLNAAGKPQVTSSVDAKVWETQTEIGVSIDINSVTTHNGCFYALVPDSGLYVSEGQSKGKTWTRKADKELKALLGSDGLFFYAFDGTAVVGTEDFVTWTPCGFENFDKLPVNSTRIFSHETPANHEMRSVALIGQCDSVADRSVAWYKVSSLNPKYNQQWEYMDVTAENKYALPKLMNLSVAENNGALYAIGRVEKDGQYTMSGFYESFDNGLAWHKKSYKWVLPADLKAEDGVVSLININKTIWAVQKGGHIWKATIR